MIALLLSLVHFLLVKTCQILRNLRKAAYILAPCFLTNFLITKSRLSLSNTEILCDEHVDATEVPVQVKSLNELKIVIR